MKPAQKRAYRAVQRASLELQTMLGPFVELEEALIWEPTDSARLANALQKANDVFAELDELTTTLQAALDVVEVLLPEDTPVIR